MAKLYKDAKSYAEVVPLFERDEYHAYIRTNLVRVEDKDSHPNAPFWQYDEEVLTHTEYMERLEKKVAEQEEANLNVMIGLAEVYEAMNSEEVV